MPPEAMTRESDAETRPAQVEACVHRHLQLGWWGLLIFLTLGVVLETLHGLKVGFYLDPASETQRLLWTLAHAHGALLSLISIAFAATCRLAPRLSGRARDWASRCLFAACLLVPLGFFFGGLWIYPETGDPGRWILLTPVGALLLFTAVLLTALGSRRAD
jgi:hypothetical protein